MHFALIYKALLTFMYKFNRVFDSEDMFVFIIVDKIHHGRHGSGLARTGGPGHQHQTARHHRNIPKNLPHSEIFHGQNLRGDGAKHTCGASILVERIDSKARDARHFKGKVCLEKLFVVLALLVVHDIVNEFVNLFVVHRRQIDAANVAVNTDHWRQTR